jgi:hypothetical protein
MEKEKCFCSPFHLCELDGYVKWDSEHPATSAKKIFDLVLYTCYQRKKRAQQLMDSSENGGRTLLDSSDIPMEEEEEQKEERKKEGKTFHALVDLLHSSFLKSSRLIL